MNGYESIGFVETASLVAAIEAADAMVKAAYVTLTGSHTIGAGRVCVTVHGDLASCQAAVAAGRAAAERLGAFLQGNVIARPDQDTDSLWDRHMPEADRRKAARKERMKAAPGKAQPSSGKPVPAAPPAGKKASSAKKGTRSKAGRKERNNP